MTPDERCDGVQRWFWSNENKRGTVGLWERLTEEFRAAENDALERAAQVVDKQDPDCCYVNAQDVRALKHPVE